MVYMSRASRDHHSKVDIRTNEGVVIIVVITTPNEC